MHEQVEEGWQDVALPMGEQVAQAALLCRLFTLLWQRQRVLQLLKYAPAEQTSQMSLL